jgi:hypothetical protein
MSWAFHFGPVSNPLARGKETLGSWGVADFDATTASDNEVRVPFGEHECDYAANSPRFSIIANHSHTTSTLAADHRMIDQRRTESECVYVDGGQA